MSNQEVVLNAALPLFLRYGYRKTSMEDVARASGFSRQSIYLGIPTRKSFYAVVRHTFQNIQNRILVLHDSSKNITNDSLGFCYFGVRYQLMRPCLPWMSVEVPLHSWRIHSRI